MINFLKNNKRTIFYTICFALLGVIETQNEAYLNMPFFDNSTGILFAMLAISSYNLKELQKKNVLIGGLIGVVFGICYSIFSIATGRNTDVKFFSLLFTSVLLGFAFFLFIHFKCYKKIVDKKNSLLLILWTVMMSLAVFSRYDGNWHKWLFLIGITYYTGDWKKDKLKDMMTGACNGIIVCFFLIQGAGFVFRPYDYIRIRYTGLYVNASRNAIFYLMVYCAFLLKLFLLKEKKAWFVVHFLFAGSIPAFMSFTGSRSGLVGIIMVTLLFLITAAIKRERISTFFVTGILIVVIYIISIPIAYGAIRFIPAVFHHPIWVMGDQYFPDYSIHSWDPIDSDKYVTFADALKSNLGRFAWFINDKKDDMEESETTGTTGEGKATEADETSYSVKNEVSVNIRLAIWKGYLADLNIIGGHEYLENGVLLNSTLIRHAHNAFIQWAFDFGLISGILYLGLTVSLVVCGIVDIIKKKDIFISSAMTIFPLAFSTFGFFEYDWSHRQISFAMLWVCMLYLFVRKCLNKTEEEN